MWRRGCVGVEFTWNIWHEEKEAYDEDAEEADVGIDSE